MPSGIRIGKDDAANRRRILEEGVRAGSLRRGREPNPSLLWRFDGAGFVLKCFGRADGAFTFWTDAPPDIVAAIDGRQWDRLPVFVPPPRIESLGSRRNGRAALARRPPPARNALSADQHAVFERILAWAGDDGCPLLTLGGYAGTGKTTLVTLLAAELGRSRRLAFCAYTGKAANVLRQKLLEAGLDAARDDCSTIHGLIYQPQVNEETGEVLGWVRVEKLDADLVIVDEASMVNAEIWEDLRSYGRKILAVGDHGQLPPVDPGSGKNLVENPDLRLEKIHRQAEGNPIISFASFVREGGRPEDFAGSADGRLRIVGDADEAGAILAAGPANEDALLDRSVLCRRNRTRQVLNARLRSLRGLGGLEPVPGDAAICLRNVRLPNDSRLFNGMRGVIESARTSGRHHVEAAVRFPDDDLRLRGFLNLGQFGRETTFGSFDEIRAETGQSIRTWDAAGLLFDFGDALTVHKAQGSQFRRVMVIEELPPRTAAGDDHRRWLYTAATRAADELIVVPAAIARDFVAAVEGR